MVSAETGGAASGETARNVSRRHTDRCESALAVYSCTDTDTQAARQSYVVVVVVHDPPAIARARAHTRSVSELNAVFITNILQNTVTPTYLIHYDYSTVTIDVLHNVANTT